MGLRNKTKLEAIKNTPHDQGRMDQQPSYEFTARYEDDSRVELDVIERLKSNIAMLDDLQQRLSFMNGELENIIGSRK